MNSTSPKPIWIGSDHGGYELKQQIIAHLQARTIPWHDVGSNSAAIVRYPHFAGAVVEAILTGDAERGILICSTGIGMSIIANRYPGIRAALCTSTYMAKMTRAHNDANVLCLGGGITGGFEAIDILDTWLAGTFEGGLHRLSLDLIRDAEERLNPRGWKAQPASQGS